MSKAYLDDITDLETAKEMIDSLVNEQQHLIEEYDVHRSVSRFWKLFYSETIRLFGDKQSGTLEHMLKKAMVHLEFECRILASAPEPVTEKGESSSKKKSTFDLEGFSKYADKQRREEFRKAYPSTVVLDYYTLTNDSGEVGLVMGFDPPMDRNDAIKMLTKKYNFPSFDACYQHLKRAKVKGLPSTWPKA
ncbi:hypothetical protein A9Q79_10315 [Methylophaga sp. 42_25_T18]|nr:hypothetical protein A9Q79_10315 [Methylophaga sp. 42_25_T18]